MSCTRDPEFTQALEPLLPMLAAGPTPEVHDIHTRRQTIQALFGTLKDAIPDLSDVSNYRLTVKSYDGAEINVIRIYPNKVPLDARTSAFIHVHGGGMIAGSADLFIKSVAVTAGATRAQFFSVDYRKAPEHPHPTPTEDVYAALKWLNQNADTFNIDRARIGITGESAGGGIAAGVAIMARDQMLWPPLAKQVLVYPMLDDRNLSPIDSMEEIALWKAADNITGWTALLGDKAGKDDVSPYAAPGRLESVEGLPSIYIDVGELDIFKHEAIEYIARFVRANVSAEFHLYPGLPHGWECIAPNIPATKRATENRVRALSSI
jgi:acetyl esterase/lipase